MKRPLFALFLLAALALGVAASPSHAAPAAALAVASPSAATSVSAVPFAPSTTFAVIGDYGTANPNAKAVSKLVKKWNPSYVVALGDDYYHTAGGVGTAKYDRSTGQFYGRWLKDISTTGRLLRFGPAPVNGFFPCLGNHDYTDAKPAPATYETYFNLPGAGFTNSSGNEAYYDFVEGRVHFFVIDSNPQQTSGITSDSVQAQWLHSQLASSTSEYNVVYFHHPPYSSDNHHGSTSYMQWPFAEWGADVVMSGHAHDYERIETDTVTYIVNGLGGDERYGFLRQPLPGSAVRYAANFGAQKVTVTADGMRFRFYSVRGTLVDDYTARPRADRVVLGR